VDAHFEARSPWYSYHERFRDSGARLVGARPGEVVMMNGLTVNLHLMFVSFYRPTAERHAVLMEDCAFPSDTYAVKSQIRFHGYDPEEALIVARPRPGESTLRTEDLEELLDRRGSEIALVFLGAVNYFTGQWFDLPGVTTAARRHGCMVGLDLAHAAGNVPLALHDWQVDFAVWCSYKYLNSGPGAVAGCFVHERHGESADLPRFAGWWGNDPSTRFRMHLQPEFEPFAGAEGWQLSNPPILAMAPLEASLDLFDEAGMERLRAKSVRLTGYLQSWVDHVGNERLSQPTPRDPAARGCQISLRAVERPRALFESLRSAGVVGDFRQPDVVRVAPVPLYNSFHDVWRFGQALSRWAAGDRG
jgi:kynureninase